MTEVVEQKIMTKKRFSLAVESLVSSHNMNYIDAAAHVVQEKGLDYKSMKRLMTDSLKAKIEAEAKSLNLLRVKKGNKLPI
tara:strand:+ start:525 stop:767 length:243 start_codon:yes stop_codon:yes gene_type:complete